MVEKIIRLNKFQKVNLWYFEGTSPGITPEYFLNIFGEKSSKQIKHLASFICKKKEAVFCSTFFKFFGPAPK